MTDYNLINDYARNTVRHLRNQSNEKAKSDFKNLVKNGKAAPGYTRIAQQTALEESARILDKEVFERRTPINEARQTHLMTATSLLNFWKDFKTETKEFEENFKKMYPKSWKKRLAIEPFLKEIKGEIKPASNYKKAKQITAFFRKFTNKML